MSIFELENRLDVRKEFDSIVSALNQKDTIFYDGSYMSFHHFLNKYIFNLWEYRDTFTDLDEYLEHIGISNRMISGYDSLKKESFLNFMELLLNLLLVIDYKIGMDNVDFINIKTKNILPHNIPIILEKMNYEIYNYEDTVRIRKRDADVDSILDIVPKNVSELLLSYNDIRNNNIDSRKSILKKIDVYIDKNKSKYKSYDQKLLDSIDTIMNKMGINHEPDEYPYNELKENDLIEWYDKCFKMMIHLIRTEDIIKIKKERTELVNLSSNQK